MWCMRPRRLRQRRVGVVLLHENFNTKFGTHRMFYQVGEALAAAGFYALRYDNRGMCDSPGINALTFDGRVADVGPATQFFKKEYRLDSVFFWGLCMGAAVALHASAQSGAEMPEGIMLCSLLADPRDVSLPQFGYGSQPFPSCGRAVARQRVEEGVPVRDRRHLPQECGPDA